jgi:hypothetical protein
LGLDLKSGRGEFLSNGKGIILRLVAQDSARFANVQTVAAIVREDMKDAKMNGRWCF